MDVTTIWIDPGGTSGVAIVKCDVAWLAGEGPASWEGLGAATSAEWRQYGKLPFNATAGPPLRPAVSGSTPLPDDDSEIMQAWAMNRMLRRYAEACWGYERFIPRTRVTSDEMFSPTRIVAMLKYGEYLIGPARTPFWHLPSVMAIADNDRLKRAGLYCVGAPHATDAARHAAAFLRSCRQQPEKCAAAWPEVFGG